MEQKFQSSFIPKKQIEIKGIAKVKRPATMFFWLSVLIFGLAVIVAGTLFVFGRFVLPKELEERKLAIQRQIDSFDRELTQTLTIMKKRIDSGEELLSKHVAASAAFSLIESLTVKSIFFDDFIFSAEPGRPGKIEASGQAPNYAILAFQSDTLKQSDKLSNVSFSNLNLNEFGRVVFNLEADIDSQVISYRENLLASAVVEEEAATSTTTTEASEDQPAESEEETENSVPEEDI